MQKRYIAPAIMLAAGATVSIVNIINKVDLIDYLESLLIVLILFYILGKIATVIITKVTSSDKKQVIEEKQEDPNPPAEVQLSEDQAITNEEKE
jgi:hypothetical protein